MYQLIPMRELSRQLTPLNSLQPSMGLSGFCLFLRDPAGLANRGKTYPNRIRICFYSGLQPPSATSAQPENRSLNPHLSGRVGYFDLDRVCLAFAILLTDTGTPLVGACVAHGRILRDLRGSLNQEYTCASSVRNITSVIQTALGLFANHHAFDQLSV